MFYFKMLLTYYCLIALLSALTLASAPARSPVTSCDILHSPTRDSPSLTGSPVLLSALRRPRSHQQTASEPAGCPLGCSGHPAHGHRC